MVGFSHSQPNLRQATRIVVKTDYYYHVECHLPFLKTRFKIIPASLSGPLFEPVDHVVNQCNCFPCLVCHVRGTDSRRLDSGLDMSTADGG